MKIKILGISASPRKNGNTDYMVQLALLAARQIKGVETEFVHLGDYKYKGGCNSCYRCDRDPSLEHLCRGIKDDHNIIVKKELEANGFIWGSPVYIAGPSAQWKMWADRHECMDFGTRPLGNKPVGFVTIGACRSGGQVQTIEDMMRVALMLDMIPIGAAAANTSQAGAGVHGACGIQVGWPETKGKDLFGKDSKTWVQYDRAAIQNCLVIGERVAEMAKVIEAGFTLVNPENGETRWPVHLLSDSQACLDLVEEYESKGLIPRIDRKGTHFVYQPIMERAREFGKLSS